MNLLPQVKKIEIADGYLAINCIAPYNEDIDYRLKKAIDRLPCHIDGVKLIIKTKDGNSEKYVIDISSDTIEITSEGLNGAFYGIQTLRQILKAERVPYLHIEDEPDFEYRGLYHDITRGKIPTVCTLKKLIDNMAYFKMNSLQLYVEHTYPFEECREFAEKWGAITPQELCELDALKERPVSSLDAFCMARLGIALSLMGKPNLLVYDDIFKGDFICLKINTELLLRMI